MNRFILILILLCPQKRSRPYTVPFSQRELFRRELERLVEIGVLEKCGRADWVSGTFCVPKKDGRVRWVSDFSVR